MLPWHSNHFILIHLLLFAVKKISGIFWIHATSFLSSGYFSSFLSLFFLLYHKQFSWLNGTMREKRSVSCTLLCDRYEWRWRTDATINCWCKCLIYIHLTYIYMHFRVEIQPPKYRARSALPAEWETVRARSPYKPKRK